MNSIDACSLAVIPVFFEDSDGDQFGNPDVTVEACEAPPGFVEDDTDCDDTDSEVNPDAEEICNGDDDDCDGATDEDAAGNPLTQATTCGVGECSDNEGIETCSGGAFGGDTCDPLAGAIPETCNGNDDDCDGSTDEDAAGNPLTQVTTCGVGACADMRRRQSVR